MKHPDAIEIARTVPPGLHVVAETTSIVEPLKTGPDPDIHNNNPTANAAMFDNPLDFTRASSAEKLFSADGPLPNSIFCDGRDEIRLQLDALNRMEPVA